jgi:ABC-2 type transport system ATP-binding protein
MPDAAIQITNLVKQYAGQGDSPPKMALKGVSFDVPEGGVVGRLGANGAGEKHQIKKIGGVGM